MNVSDYPYSIEELILMSVGDMEADFAWWFAFNIMNRRWLEVESIIMKNPYVAYLYAITVIKERWLEAEPYILKEENWAEWYLQKFPEAGTYSKDVPANISVYVIKEIPNTVTSLQLANILNVLSPSLVGEINEPIVRNLRVLHEPLLKRHIFEGDCEEISIYDILNDKVPDFWNRFMVYQYTDFK